MTRWGGLNRAPGRGERFFTIFVFLLSSASFASFMGGEETGKGALAIVMPALWSLIYLVAVILFRKHCGGFLDRLRRDKLLVFLVALAMISAFWSEEPGHTLQRSVALFGTTFFGVYFASRFSLVDQLRILSRVFLIGAVLSPIVVAVLPQYGIAGPEFGHAWQGIYGHKNGLGSAMALGTIAFTFRAVMDRKGSLRWWAAAGLSVGLLLLSHAATSLLACAVSLMTFTLAPILRRPLRRIIWAVVGMGALAVGAGLWALNNLQFVMSLLGRDQSFTGRTTVWMVSIAMITRRPWLGYGYNEFWPAYGSDMVAHLTGLAEMSHAILNLWLDLGLLGVLIFILQYSKSLWCAVVAVRNTKSVEWFWPLVFLVYLATVGLVESIVLQRNGLSWIVFTSVAIQVSFRAQRKVSTVASSAIAASFGMQNRLGFNGTGGS